MKLSTRTRYGVRLMMALARQYGQGPIFLRQVAEEEDISEKYLSQIIIALRTRGLVNSTRGAHGGYSLASPPGDIRLREIVALLEGGLSLVDCCRETDSCDRSDDCSVHKVWLALEERISDYLASVTLQQLIEGRQEKNKGKLQQ